MRAARYLNLQPSLITSIVSCIEQDYIYTVKHEFLFNNMLMYLHTLFIKTPMYWLLKHVSNYSIKLLSFTYFVFDVSSVY